MRRIILLLMIMSVIVFALSGCNVATTTIDSDGITRTTSREENTLLNIGSEQNMVTPAELLKNMPNVWQDVVVLANGESYVCNAVIEGGLLPNYVVFELEEKKMDIETLMGILMGGRKEQAVEVDDMSAEGQKYWAIIDDTSGRNLEELHYYTYEGAVADLFDYQRDMLIYDDQSQEIKVDESLASVSDSDAISVTADVLAKMGLAGMSILDGYNYQTEVTFYLLPQYTNLPVIADRNNAQ